MKITTLKWQLTSTLTTEQYTQYIYTYMSLPKISCIHVTVSGTVEHPYMYKCFVLIHTHMYVSCACLVPAEVSTSDPLKLEFDSCEISCEYWELNQGPPALNCWAKSLNKITKSTKSWLSVYVVSLQARTKEHALFKTVNCRYKSMGLSDIAESLSSMMSTALDLIPCTHKTKQNHLIVKCHGKYWACYGVNIPYKTHVTWDCTVKVDWAKRAPLSWID